MIASLIVAAGKGTRTGLATNKLLVREENRTILGDTLAVFHTLPCVLVYATRDKQDVTTIASAHPNITLVEGGEERGASVLAGLVVCKAKGYDTVLIHDGARPYLATEDLAQCIEAVEQYGSCVMTHLCLDSVLLDNSAIARERITLVSTPQAFRTDEILDAYMHAAAHFSDDAQVYTARYGAPHYLTLSHANPKITTSDDLNRWRNRIPRTGLGVDEHRFKDGRACVLCGVNLNLPYGLDGHSDADAPIHALMDALLSSVGEGDIGTFFPDSEATYFGADSMKLLACVLKIVASHGYAPSNVSLVLHAQRPKLASYIPAMIESLATALSLAKSSVGISATSGEGMGHIGRGEGLIAHAVATVRPIL